jgi:hypothetical protein
MELVVIAFVGTLVLMIGEFRDLARTSTIASGAALRRSTASDPSVRPVTYRSPESEQELYDAAA